MRGTRKTVRVVSSLTLSLSLALAVGVAGCKSAAQRRVATAPEPGLSGPVEPGTAVAEAPLRPAPAVSFVDRHPLLSKPRDYYDSSGNNKVVKTAAATVIGIPAGIFGELKQIVVGASNPAKY